MSVLQRGSGIFLANFEMEKACGVKIAILDAPKQMNCVVFEEGKECLAVELTPSGTDGPYKLFDLPEMPVTGEILLFPGKDGILYES